MTGRVTAAPVAHVPRRARLAAGAFMVVAALYVGSGPGRIDTIDGQLRYEVARSLAVEGRPVLRDEALRPMGVKGLGSDVYAYYGAPPSVVAVPLVWVGLKGGGEERAMALFSFTSALLGALAMTVLLLFLLDLGLPTRAALGWTAITAFATLVWPVATSAFDQVQQSFFALAATWLAWRSARDDRMTTAMWGGAAAGLLFCYQEVYAAWIPFLGLALFEGRRRIARHDLRRALAFAGAGVATAAMALAYNAWRFGTPLSNGKLSDAIPPVFGNPLMGGLGLLLSPGKSILLYSPPMILAVLGWPVFRRKHPRLALAVLGATLGHLALVATLQFYGGDWAWGPRYLVVLVPLWGVVIPSAMERLPRRWLLGTVVAAGMLVQGLALSLDHQRFFFERNLVPWFWTYDPWYYFREGGSQLLARPAELAATIREGVPHEAVRFGSGPRPSSMTYCLFGPGRLEVPRSDRWMRSFAVFYLPSPWPLWMERIPPPDRPFPLAPAAALVALVGAAGAALVIGAAGGGRGEDGRDAARMSGRTDRR